MATIKSYTDLEWSKKLAEILPVESADRCYEVGEDLDGYITKTIYTPLVHTPYNDNYIPCWSLSALLDIIKDKCGYFELVYLESTFDRRGDRLENVYRLSTDAYDVYKKEAVDACVAMIIRLNELNLL